MRRSGLRNGLFGRLILLLLAVAVLAPVSVLVSASHAEAQEPRRGRTLFDLLFNRSEERVAPPERRMEPRQRVRRQPDGNSAGSADGSVVQPGRVAPGRVAQPEAVEKQENARILLVIGDFMGGGLAEGLESSFAQSAGVRVEARANGSSGFVRDDFYDWPAEIGAIMDEIQPAAIAVMLGSNDRQQLSIGGTRESVRTPAWTNEYTARVRKLATAIRARGLPLVWVGLPAFKSNAMSADMLAFNDIYRSVAEEVGGEFVDIWDGFVDENGAFSIVGPDINGQRVRLRGSDGINLSAAGKRKVAFYTERTLNRILGDAAQPGIASLTPPGGAPSAVGPVAPVAPSQIERTLPIALGDPALDGGAILLGSASAAPRTQAAGSPVQKLTVEGTAGEPKPGRADDFAVRKLAVTPQPDTPSASTETTTAISE